MCLAISSSYPHSKFHLSRSFKNDVAIDIKSLDFHWIPINAFNWEMITVFLLVVAHCSNDLTTGIVSVNGYFKWLAFGEGYRNIQSAFSIPCTRLTRSSNCAIVEYGYLKLKCSDTLRAIHGNVGPTFMFQYVIRWKMYSPVLESFRLTENAFASAFTVPSQPIVWTENINVTCERNGW